jgi:hypothetical protein
MDGQMMRRESQPKWLQFWEDEAKSKKMLTAMLVADADVRTPSEPSDFGFRISDFDGAPPPRAGA